MGETQKGIPINNTSRIHPDILNRYCGTEGEPLIRAGGQTGAGHPADEADNSESDLSSDSTSDLDADLDEEDDDYTHLQRNITADIQKNIKHKPVKVPRHSNPFAELDPTVQTIFEGALHEVQRAGSIPEGFGLLSDEWEDTEYPSHEHIKVGRRATKLSVQLPEETWYPRAVSWAQGLYVITHVLNKVEGG